MNTYKHTSLVFMQAHTQCCFRRYECMIHTGMQMHMHMHTYVCICICEAARHLHSARVWTAADTSAHTQASGASCRRPDLFQKRQQGRPRGLAPGTANHTSHIHCDTHCDTWHCNREEEILYRNRILYEACGCLPSCPDYD